MNERLLHRYFKWSWFEFFTGILGVVLCASAINFFLQPSHLFTSGITGTAQLLRNLVIHITGIHPNFDIAGIINFCINVPLFIFAYTKLSKTFVRRTFVCMIVFSSCLTLIPIPETRIIDELITNIVIGGVMGGIGAGLVLRSCACLGGTDIIGLAITKINRNASVGMINIIINFIIFGICGLVYGLQTMIYSIIYMVFENIMVDRMHSQNISCTATIMTKKRPTKIIKFVEEELDRDCTTWEAHGENSDTVSYITYVVCSKYELSKLERNMPLLDPRAFMVKDNGISVYGKYYKNLTDQGE